MLYDSPEKNILSLLQNLGTLEHDQLIMFFSDRLSYERIEYCLQSLEYKGFISCDGKTGRYSCRSSGQLDGELLERLITAFWIPAHCGSSIVRQIYLLDYPRQLMFITGENIAYDITVCTSLNEAILSRHTLSLAGNAGLPDPVNHIALTGSAETSADLSKYGFDICCSLEPVSHMPEYRMCSTSARRPAVLGPP